MGKNTNSFEREQGLRDDNVLDVSAGICPLGPSKKVKASIRKAVGDIGSYPAPASSRLGRFFRSRFGLTEDTVLFVNSMRELLHVISASFSPGKVLIAGISPEMYAEISAASAASIRRLPFSAGPGFATDIESIGRDMTDSDLIFIANPNRISGRLMKGNDLIGMIDAASEMDTVVVVDESLIEFTGEEGLLSKAGGKENLIVLRTTANYHGLPGLELAYAVSSPTTIRKLGERSICPVSALACEAARTAYKDKAYRRLAKKFLEEEKRTFTRALKTMDRVTFYDSDCNVFLLKVECPGKNVPDVLARAGFLIKDCSGVGGLGKEYIRLSVMKHDQNQKFLRILKERCL